MSFAVFSEENKLLPAFCKPYPDELTSSWLTRLAFNHGLSTRELCSYILPKNYNKNHSLDIDRVFSNERITILAEKTNCSTDEVRATTLSSYIDTLFTCPNIVFTREAWLIPSRMIIYKDDKSGMRHHSGLMFCPGCLKQKVYFKKQWRLAISFVCIHCRYYLVDCCPHCGKGSSFMDITEYDFSEKKLDQYLVDCHHCGNDVTDCEIEIAPPDIVQLQKRLYHIMDYGLHDPAVTGVSYLRVLHIITYLLLKEKKMRDLADDVFEINGLSYNSLKINEPELRFLSVKKRAIVISMAYWLLQKWPFRFLGLCRNNLIHRGDILPEIPGAPYWFLESIYYGLSPTNPGPKPVKKKENYHEEHTASVKEKRIKIVDYDFAMDEEYDEDEIYYEPDYKCDIKRCL
jgi:TniQ